MPSEIGYSLPPSNQRPQLLSRVETTDQKALIGIKEEDALQRSGVEQAKAKVVSEAREVLDNRFPRESLLDRFRGNTEGRSLSSVDSGASISRLPNRVQAFNPLTARSSDISSFSLAESAALGLTPASAPQIDVETADEPPVPANNDRVESVSNAQAFEYPSINGSGEIAARFDAINEQIQQRSEDEFTQLRPGGPESERVSDERAQNQVRNEVIADEQQASRQNDEFARIVRRQDQFRQDEQIVADRSDQNVIDAQASENQGQQVQPTDQAAQNNNNDEPPQSRRPGEPTNSSGEPLSSEEQKEVERLARRDREVRAHEQAHARAGGSHVRGGVQLSYTTGPDGGRYAVDGEVNVDLSEASTPAQTATKMRQVRTAALAPANPSGADRAVASLAARRELDARAQIAELERADREAIAQDQQSGDSAVVSRETQEAGQAEQRENADHFAGAQSVIPDPSFSPRTSGVEQQSLQATFSPYSLSAPALTSRPVIAPASTLNIEETDEPPASPREEGNSPRYQEVAELAVDRGLHG